MASNGDITGTPAVISTQKQSHRGHEITSRTIKTPQFSYACLRLFSESTTATASQLDTLTVRSYVGSALNQLLGLTGSAISVDILKVEGRECWIRVPREDLSLVIAAVGGWTGGFEGDGKVGWKVKSSGNWLSVLVAEGHAGQPWD
ncbi:hypothetical protein VTL71DRAFT_15935 [Oculimacula yallundae]|uniref:Ribonucleases P/MRP subunit Pop8-like domain-containing protein n=1 Tax=Oculimacula yallundae TaxID=86028 RepID=A0ABR4CD15_9HELO